MKPVAYVFKNIKLINNATYSSFAYSYYKFANTFHSEDLLNYNIYLKDFYSDVQKFSDLSTYQYSNWEFYANSIEGYTLDFLVKSKVFYRVNSNIYRNIFYNNLINLSWMQNLITNSQHKLSNKIFQYNHGLEYHDLVYLENGLYKKALATEEKYNVSGIVSEIIDENVFILTTFGVIEFDIKELQTDPNVDSYKDISDSGILYLSDTQEGKVTTYDKITTTFYTPVGFYINNSAIINIMDSSYGGPLNKYDDSITNNIDFKKITEIDKNNIIQEVLNNAS